MRKLFESLLPTFSDIYKHAFLLESAATSAATVESKETLQMIYNAWTRMDSSHEEATILWATWLLHNNYIQGAGEVIAQALSRLGDNAERKEALERRWRRVLDGETQHEDMDEDEKEPGHEQEGGMEDENVEGSDDDGDIVFVE